MWENCKHQRDDFLSRSAYEQTGVSPETGKGEIDDRSLPDFRLILGHYDEGASLKILKRKQNAVRLKASDNAFSPHLINFPGAYYTEVVFENVEMKTENDSCFSELDEVIPTST